MRKWTPGPWEIKQKASINGAHIVSGDVVVCRVTQAADKSIDQKIADARLIAAAPDLLKALHQAVDHLEELREAWQRGAIHETDFHGGTRSNRNWDVLANVCRAIREAEGEPETKGGGR